MKKINSVLAYSIIGVVAGAAGIFFYYLITLPQPNYGSDLVLNHVISKATPVLSIRMDAKGEQYLTDLNGMSLYFYKKDSNGVSTCKGTCLKNWPVVVAATTTLKGHTQLKGPLSTIKLSNGKYQALYKGQALYHYAGDKVVGDMKGDGMNKVWILARP